MRLPAQTLRAYKGYVPYGCTALNGYLFVVAGLRSCNPESSVVMLSAQPLLVLLPKKKDEVSAKFNSLHWYSATIATKTLGVDRISRQKALNPRPLTIGAGTLSIGRKDWPKFLGAVSCFLHLHGTNLQGLGSCYASATTTFPQLLQSPSNGMSESGVTSRSDVFYMFLQHGARCCPTWVHLSLASTPFVPMAPRRCLSMHLKCYKMAIRRRTTLCCVWIVGWR